MSDKDFADYPKGSLSMDGGDLVDVHDIAKSYTDGEKTVSTLRQNPAGSTGGARSVSLTFKSAISEAGFERDYKKKHAKRSVVKARFKVPGETFNITGRLTNLQVTSNVDNFIEFTATILGKES